MKNAKIFSTLVGLTGAISNNGKTEQTDLLVMRSLGAAQNDLTDEDIREWTIALNKEKFTISPDCATCMNPCGNTSDYDLKDLENDPEEVKLSKECLWEAICEYGKKASVQRLEALPDAVYQGITYLTYQLEPDQYDEVTAKLR